MASGVSDYPGDASNQAIEAMTWAFCLPKKSPSWTSFCTKQRRDIACIAWAFEKDVPRTGFEIGHAATIPPPVPWMDRQSAMARNQEIERVWQQMHKPALTPKAS